MVLLRRLYRDDTSERDVFDVGNVIEKTHEASVEKSPYFSEFLESIAVNFRQDCLTISTLFNVKLAVPRLGPLLYRRALWPAISKRQIQAREGHDPTCPLLVVELRQRKRDFPLQPKFHLSLRETEELGDQAI
jgi:hypothetical protein